MYLICGLGNPGNQYKNTRHNIGFLIIDRLLKKMKIDLSTEKNKKETIIYTGKYRKQDVILAKPQTYMNLSGKSVAYLKNFYKIPDENIIIIVDDLSMPFGNIKIKPKGSDGGHNGLKSIQEIIGPNYIRVKCGIENQRKGETRDFVLGKFNPDEKDVLNDYIDFISGSVMTILGRGVQLAMTGYNKKSFKGPDDDIPTGPEKVVFATRNSHKIKEITSRLESLKIKNIIGLREFDNVPEIEENVSTFYENSLIKARACNKFFDLPALADDSGLVVPALGGEPGIYSARYAGPDSTDEMLINKLLENMKDLNGNERKAWFECVLVLCLQKDGKETIIKGSGRVNGRISIAPRGKDGFGYDPVFIPDGKDCSFAEMSSDDKNLISHRGRAVVDFIKKYRRIF